MKIIGISGWSGNGKTTLLERLIPSLMSKGYSVSTLKHAHHHFDIDKPGKDSFRHREAGATEVLISSSNRWALMHENRDGQEADMVSLIAQMTPVDILLVEGFKSENFPKIEVWREESDAPPLHLNDDTVVAVATDSDTLKTDLPLLDLNDEAAVAEFIIQKFMTRA
ncbi:molybdopterin-guanine dinucleotide biosynthesis protein B [Sneathiella aquimaris]|uniref:molybdopterin-guanine dinucleotide biosynthesis protein B n=1 Tax=Sneathiella aquimaris TaxID=2599305 RepID=UPI00146F3824|nr:molybdopterin-guanine dinucleotide biosynthesis protein B [Sneathiella aquimaris]